MSKFCLGSTWTAAMPNKHWTRAPLSGGRTRLPSQASSIGGYPQSPQHPHSNSSPLLKDEQAEKFKRIKRKKQRDWDVWSGSCFPLPSAQDRTPITIFFPGKVFSMFTRLDSLRHNCTSGLHSLKINGFPISLWIRMSRSLGLVVMGPRGTLGGAESQWQKPGAEQGPEDSVSLKVAFYKWVS